MHSLKRVIASHQTNLRNHRLFALLDQSRSREPIAEMARALAWWPLVFQDVLRLNVERSRGTGLESVVEHHQAEDAGHDQWYLEDLRLLSANLPALDELFLAKFQPLRDACYRLLSEVHREQSVSQRIALLLTLESTGHVFFESVAEAVARICPELPLRYFSHMHLGVEKEHDLFTESTDSRLDGIVMTELERERSAEMVARVYGAFIDVFSFLADRMLATGQSHIRELGTPSGVVERALHAQSS